jgi:putative membrane protein
MAILALLLHPVARIEWTRWTIHPSTVVGLAVLGALYLWRARRPPAGETAPSGWQKVAFFAALLSIFVSLNGPLHDLSDSVLFSAHMVQHLVLTLLMPPLMLVALKGWMLRPALDVPVLGAMLRRLTKPIACFATFNVVVAAWHLPLLYNAAVASHPIHILQHLMFMAAAVLMWWPYLSPLPELPRLSYPGQMLYSFLMVIPMSIVSIYIAMADEILYPAYASAARMWPITPMQDQMIGGLIMWIPGGLFFYGVMSVVFFKWVSRGAGDDTASAQVGWKPV